MKKKDILQEFDIRFWLINATYLCDTILLNCFCLNPLRFLQKKKKLASYFLLLFKLIFQKVEIEHYPPFSGKDFE